MFFEKKTFLKKKIGILEKTFFLIFWSKNKKKCFDFLVKKCFFLWGFLKNFFLIFEKKIFFFEFLGKKNFFFFLVKKLKKNFFLLFGKKKNVDARAATRRAWRATPTPFPPPFPWTISSTRCCSCKHCT